MIVSIEPAITIQTNSGKTITKRELILDITKYNPTTGERSPYESTPLFEFTGDDCAQLDLYARGQAVRITFDLRGVSYVDKTTGRKRIFNSIRPYRIEALNYAQPTATPQQAVNYQQPAQPPYQQPQAQPQPYYQQPQQPAQPGGSGLPF